KSWFGQWSPEPPSSATPDRPVPDRWRVTRRAAVSRTAGSGTLAERSSTLHVLALPSPRLADHSRTWPSPKTIHLVLVSSRRPHGPRAWYLSVLMPISAPSPSWPPSLNRVLALTITAELSTPATKPRAAARSPVTMVSVCAEPCVP